jgi:putative endonuclease
MAVVLNNTQYYVYVLRSLRDGKLYTGVTSDLDRRVREHNSGKTKSLRGRRPLRSLIGSSIQPKCRR